MAPCGIENHLGALCTTERGRGANRKNCGSRRMLSIARQTPSESGQCAPRHADHKLGTLLISSTNDRLPRSCLCRSTTVIVCRPRPAY